MLALRSIHPLVSRNPLIRRSDRVEALAIILVAFVALLALPAVVHFASDVRDERVREITAQAKSVHAVQATAVADGTVPIADELATADATVSAEWTQGYLPHVETVKVDHYVRAGDRFTVWLDADQRPSAAPRDPSSASGEVALAAFAVYCTIVAIAGFLLLLLVEALNFLRRRTWDAQIRLLVDNGGDWVNKQS